MKLTIDCHELEEFICRHSGTYVPLRVANNQLIASIRVIGRTIDVALSVKEVKNNIAIFDISFNNYTSVLLPLLNPIFGNRIASALPQGVALDLSNSVLTINLCEIQGVRPLFNTLIVNGLAITPYGIDITAQLN